MARVKIKDLQITFKGVELLSSTATLADDTFFQKTYSYNVATRQLVGVGKPLLVDESNEEIAFPLSTVEDFAGLGDALAKIAEREQAFSAGAIGELAISTGAQTETMTAGITSCEFSVSLAGLGNKPFRLTSSYEFLIA